MTEPNSASPRDTAEDDIDAHPPRTIYPVRRREDWPLDPPAGEPVLRLIVLDTETTGFDPPRHSVIEICAARICIDETGRVCAVETIRTGLRDPCVPLSETIRELTGLTDGDLRGRSIDEQDLAAFLASGEAVVAFNASFDRPHIENILPIGTLMPWVCAMKDIDWRGWGFEPGSQGYLLSQAGYYNPVKHRARDDVLSLIQLIDHRCDGDKTVATKLLEALDRKQWRFEAQGAGYSQRHELKDRGYRWSTHNKLWHKVVRSAEFRREYRWYKSLTGQRPAVVTLPASERYRADHTWKPQPPKKTNLEWPEGDPF